MSCKYSQKLLDHAKQSIIDASKTASKRTIQKILEATGELICNNISEHNYESFNKFTAT